MMATIIFTQCGFSTDWLGILIMAKAGYKESFTPPLRAQQ